MAKNSIKIVEELTQTQLDELKIQVFWGDSALADFSNLSFFDKNELQKATLFSEIPNTTIYKLFRDVYFKDTDFLRASVQFEDIDESELFFDL